MITYSNSGPGISVLPQRNRLTGSWMESFGGSRLEVEVENLRSGYRSCIQQKAPELIQIPRQYYKL